MLQIQKNLKQFHTFFGVFAAINLVSKATICIHPSLKFTLEDRRIA